MKSNVKLTAIILILLFFGNIAFANVGDIYQKSDYVRFATAKELVLAPKTDSRLKSIVINQEKYLYEGLEGKIYNLSDVVAAYNSDKDDYLYNLDDYVIETLYPATDGKTLIVQEIQTKEQKLKAEVIRLVNIERANILNPHYEQISVGFHYDENSYYRYYWVQMFYTPY